MLVKHLSEIKQYDKSLFSQFRTKIKKTKDINLFFGIRFEINVAATLIKHNIQFKKTEAPDFSITFLSGREAIECTSARLSKEKDSIIFVIR